MKKEIEARHMLAFRDWLTRAKNVMPIGPKSQDDFFAYTPHWPEQNEAACFVPNDIITFGERFKPLYPILMAANPPFFNPPTKEPALGIALSKAQNNTESMPFACYMYASGRMVILAFGLLLDSAGQWQIKPQMTGISTELISTASLAFMEWCIKSLPRMPMQSERLRSTALRQFSALRPS